jgi:ABC-type sugar transport system substrate-binding protein
MTRRLIGLLITLALGFLVMPSVTAAQQPAKVYRIGSLRVGTATPSDGAPFQEAMRRLGYVPDHNLFIETHSAATSEQLPARAAELAARQVDLIMTFGILATRAA